MINYLQWIERWYESQCNGDWEHTYGIKISTLDNPGWRIKISLEETEIKDKCFSTIDIERTEEDWIYCKVEELIFKGYGGSKNLEELLKTFKEWVETN
jgi:hypothetical protein